MVPHLVTQKENFVMVERGEGPGARHEQLLRAVQVHPALAAEGRRGVQEPRGGAAAPEYGGQSQAGWAVRVHPLCLLQHLLP